MAVNLAPISGTSSSDALLGTQDDDTLNVLYPSPISGGGEDKMNGSNGNGTYYVNSIKDLVVEGKAAVSGVNTAGVDTVMASVSY